MASANDKSVSQDFASALLVSAKQCKDAKNRVSALIGSHQELSTHGPELFQAILDEFHPTSEEYLPDRQLEFVSAVQGSGESAISAYECIKFLGDRYAKSRGRPMDDREVKQQLYLGVRRGA